MANTNITAVIGSLALTGEDKLFYNSGDMNYILTGLQPLVAERKPALDSLAITGELPRRAAGLLTTGQQPVIQITEIVPAVVGTVQFSSTEPQTVPAAPPSKTVAPTTGPHSFASDAPSISWSLSAVIGSVSLSGIAPTTEVNEAITPAPSRRFTILRGLVPTISFAFVGGKPGDGTLIQGEAVEGSGTVDIPGFEPTTDSLNRYTICDRSGFKVKPLKNPLVKDPYGNYVRAESSDIERHPQERVVSRPEEQRGSIRPEPTREDEFTFITDDDPITQDDL